MKGRGPYLRIGATPSALVSRSRAMPAGGRRSKPSPRFLSLGRTRFAALRAVIAVHRAGWKDGGWQEKLWRSSLRDYAMPKLGGRPVNRIQTADVMAVLLPIWNEKRVTAQRVRRRIFGDERTAESGGEAFIMAGSSVRLGGALRCAVSSRRRSVPRPRIPTPCTGYSLPVR